VELLAWAIATQEGFFTPGTIPALRHNPGDIRYASQLNASAPGWDGKQPAPIATFKGDKEGITGLYRQLWLQVATGQTVRQIIGQWAPPNENNTSAYLANVLKWTGLPADTPVLQLLPNLQKLS
jgi:hypothetical protein